MKDTTNRRIELLMSARTNEQRIASIQPGLRGKMCVILCQLKHPAETCGGNNVWLTATSGDQGGIRLSSVALQPNEIQDATATTTTLHPECSPDVFALLSKSMDLNAMLVIEYWMIG
jgi:hypothetical protein